MVKIRLIPVLFIKNGLIVRSEKFNYHHNIGNIIHEAARYNEWLVDELIYIDISRKKNYDLRRDDYNLDAYFTIDEIIKKVSKVCFMPLSFGGGIRNMEDIDLRIRSGADKITINAGVLENPDLVRRAAEKYGSQCIVISIDYKIIDNSPIVFTHFGNNNTNVNIFDWLIECEELGAGEIFLNSIDRDGMGCGYDLETIGSFVEYSKLPVVACGGAADEFDFLEIAKNSKVSAIAAGNMFHFTERSYPRAKKFLKQNGVYVR